MNKYAPGRHIIYLFDKFGSRLKDKFFITHKGYIDAENIGKAAIKEIDEVNSYAVVRVLSNSLSKGDG